MSRVNPATNTLLDFLLRPEAATIARLLNGERIDRPKGAEAFADSAVRQHGLCCDARSVWLDPELERLDAVVVGEMLGSSAHKRWPSLEVVPSIESTNESLMALGAQAGDVAMTTEFQSGGRGRRGRSWISPVGRNIALSVGYPTELGLQAFAGLSLVVGLAVADALRSLGLATVWLKWPNDLLAEVEGGDNEFAKLGGILVELQQHAQGSVAVIGIGLNFSSAGLTREFIPQPVADIHELDPRIGRNAVLAAVLNSLADYLDQYAQIGFAPMTEMWESLHAYSDRDVDVLRGDLRVTGRVLGVQEKGGLRVRTATGVEVLDAGEVSLRGRTS